MIVYLARDGAEIGEYPREMLEQLARDGQLQPTDLCWFEGMESWLSLEDFLGAEVWKAKAPVAAPRKKSPTQTQPLKPARVAISPKRVRSSSSLRNAPRIPTPEPRPAVPAAPESPWIFLGAMICVGLIWATAIAIKLSRPANLEPPPVSLLEVAPPPENDATE